MPLSDHEQRLLDEIEQALYAEDPKFAAHVRSARSRSRTRRDLILCVVGGLIGLVLVFLGLVLPTTIIALSVVGFVLLVGSAGWAAQTVRGRGRGTSNEPIASSAATPRPQKQSGLRTRMEDRLRKRFEEE